MASKQTQATALLAFVVMLASVIAVHSLGSPWLGVLATISGGTGFILGILYSEARWEVSHGE